VIGAEIAVARSSWEGAKVVVFAVVVFAVAGWLWWTYLDAQRRDTELKALRVFQSSVEERQRLDVATDIARQTALAGRTTQNDDQTRVVVIHDTATKEAADEDPDTADFLRQRIPARLRDADARARRSRQLDEDHPRR
jgi:hypothetical protein